MIAALFRIVMAALPLAGPLGVLAGFLPRLIKLKHEKALHTVVGEKLPVSAQTEIDSHTTRVRFAFLRLALSASMLMSLFSVWNWRVAYVAKVRAESAKNEAVEAKIIAERQAMNDRATVENAKTAVNEWQVAYENLRASKEVIARQQDIVSVKREEVLKNKTAGQVKRAKNESKRDVTVPVDVGDWMSIQTFGGDASAAGGSVSATDASPNINP